MRTRDAGENIVEMAELGILVAWRGGPKKGLMSLENRKVPWGSKPCRGRRANLSRSKERDRQKRTTVSISSLCLW